MNSTAPEKYVKGSPDSSLRVRWFSTLLTFTCDDIAPSSLTKTFCDKLYEKSFGPFGQENVMRISLLMLDESYEILFSMISSACVSPSFSWMAKLMPNNVLAVKKPQNPQSANLCLRESRLRRREDAVPAEALGVFPIAARFGEDNDPSRQAYIL